MRKILQRLWLPTTLFLFVLLLDLSNRHWLPKPAEDLVGPLPYRLRFYPAPIFLWLLGAWLAVRVIDVFFWDRLVTVTLGRSVPRLLKDLLVVFVFVVAVVLGWIAYKRVLRELRRKN